MLEVVIDMLQNVANPISSPKSALDNCRSDEKFKLTK